MAYNLPSVECVTLRYGTDRSGDRLKRRKLVLGAVALAACVALFFWGRQRFHFSFNLFGEQLMQADWFKIGISIACIYFGFVLRSVRWALFLRPSKKVPPLSLVGTQVIGFTAVGLAGRVADPVRPYLVARKTGLPLSSQLAVYVVERLFDVGSMALLFSTVILLAGGGSVPHPEIVKRAGEWAMAVTLGGALFLVIVRRAGKGVASFFERVLGMASGRLGKAAGEKIRMFHAGLDTMRTLADFGMAVALSLAIWCLVALACMETARAFVASPPLAAINWPNAMLLFAVANTVSGLQLPVIGWFAQIAVVAAGLTGFYNIGTEAATACSAMILFVTSLSIIPVGLLWANFEQTSLRKFTGNGEIAERLATEPTRETS
ncbi:MAG TPA: lysylphosphatidylglycerol synthase transmembrane domain-containing protein [Terracidiphilus sp.]|nr:lysylphosphatidylglycerol synthase transmembrane domain-containing protein [Terracidiphilus sp.]